MGNSGFWTAHRLLGNINFLMLQWPWESFWWFAKKKTHEIHKVKSSKKKWMCIWYYKNAEQ